MKSKKIHMYRYGSNREYFISMGKNLLVFIELLSEEHKIFYLKNAYNIPARQIMRTIFLFCKGGQLCDFFAIFTSLQSLIV